MISLHFIVAGHYCSELALEQHKGIALVFGSPLCRFTRLPAVSLPTSGPSYVLRMMVPKYALD